MKFEQKVIGITKSKKSAQYKSGDEIWDERLQEILHQGKDGSVKVMIKCGMKGK